MRVLRSRSEVAERGGNGEMADLSRHFAGWLEAAEPGERLVRREAVLGSRAAKATQESVSPSRAPPAASRALPDRCPDRIAGVETCPETSAERERQTPTTPPAAIRMDQTPANLPC